MTYREKVNGRLVDTWTRDEPDWRGGCSLIAMMFLAGLIIGFIMGTHVAPMPAPATTPQPDASVLTGSVGARTQVRPSASPEQTSAQLSGIGSPLEGRKGIIAQATIGGPNYLAIPIGPGHLVKICGPAACLTLRSTDAGPNHERLVAGRIADVALGHWKTICGLPQSRGTCRGSWQTLDSPPLPATDTELP